MKTRTFLGAFSAASALLVPLPSGAQTFEFKGGYPTQETVRKAYDSLDLNRAIQAYRIFYPTVSGYAILKGNEKLGIFPNKSSGTLDTQPRHVGYTLNSDTPYAPLFLDLTDGPMVVELPAGPLICIAMDLNQRWVADLGVPGPSAGKGDKVVFLPPGYKGGDPAGYRVARSTTFRMLVGVRSLPVGGNVPEAVERIKTIKVRPLDGEPDKSESDWKDLTPIPQDTTPLAWETNFQYWQALNDVVQSEPPFDGYRDAYGELAALGIEKGRPFEPDSRMKDILTEAARTANAQMRVESFADRRADRIVWPDRKWEWAALRFEDGDFNATHHVDTYARDKWFFQAIGSSPAMFRRDTKAGSLYWLAQRDRTGAFLEGGKTYKLSVPQPVPAHLFWSVTVYDAETRSQIATEQGKAALRSLFELKDEPQSGVTELHFGPQAPEGQDKVWIRTIPGKGWFAYFRIYGPGEAAFDGTWKPADFEEVK
ncbi:DUF1254 domain-containing protein [Luteolibacter yonseiensis]|uniref:DUF1254 domain-containing protein n=1 Tax=Luteolibacter yonseiensis TaxID=1144680 RepID=A0A934R2I7_9BACT|nr:DUF1254 domain-containing protein [Luteolibacter yonseiensis]MBK1814084.1 DUF1254 domain-containing protein [Luteolibacter yonseiensis]